MPVRDGIQCCDICGKPREGENELLAGWYRLVSINGSFRDRKARFYCPVCSKQLNELLDEFEKMANSKLQKGQI